MFFNQYPYLNLNDLNLDYIMKAIKEMRYEVTNFVSINAIKYADPIQWNITSQYEKNTIVIDPVTGTAYISVAPVPAGVALTRPEYWTVVFDLGSFVTRAAQNFTSRWESDTTTTATFPTNAGEWLVWGDVLYKALVNITAGDTYVVGGNIDHFTIEDLYNTYLNTIASILAMVGDLVNLTTTDKTSIVNAINEVNAKTLQLIVDVGDLNNLTTTDKTSIVNAINENRSDIITNANDIKGLLAFESVRIASGSGRAYQSVCEYNGMFYGSNDMGGTFEIDVIDPSSMSVTNTYSYPYSVHPNAIFVVGDVLYVVDSINRDIYTISMITMTLIAIDTSLRVYNVYGGSYDGNDIYFIGNDIYKCDSSLNILETITLDDVNVSNSIIVQGIFVYDNVIYKVCNCPNCLIAHDLNGRTLGVIDIGIGDGYFPYGEIECLFVNSDSEVLMTGSPYYTYGGIIYNYFQLFRTNLATRTTGNSHYGQNHPITAGMYFDKNAAFNINPDGTIGNPFTNIYEGCCVFQYHQHLDQQFTQIVFMSAADYSNDIFVITNSIVDISYPPSNLNFKYALIDSCSSVLHRFNANTLIIDGGSITIMNSTIQNLTLYQCSAILSQVIVSTSVSVTYAVIEETQCTFPASITNSGSHITRHIDKLNSLLTSGVPVSLDNVTQAILKDTDSDSILSLTLLASTLPAQNSIQFAIFKNAKTALAGGTAFTFKTCFTFQDGATIVFLPVSLTIDASYQLVLSFASMYKLDGTTFAAGSIYAEFLKLEQNRI